MTIDQIISLAVSGVVIIIGLLVIKLYWNIGHPSVIEWGKSKRPEAWFAHGIVAAFTSTTINAFYFKLWNRMGLWDWVQETSTLMNSWMNILVVSLMIWAAFCHLYSAFLNLPVEDKSKWNWMTVAFYPKNYLIVRWLNKRGNPK